MRKMKALQPFDEGGTPVSVGDVIEVTDEQGLRLEREGKAEREHAQPAPASDASEPVAADKAETFRAAPMEDSTDR